MTENKTDIAIIGGGPAGLSAAIYALRFELDALVFDPFPGGIVTKTDIIENYPGFKSITGMELSEKIKEHATSFKVKFVHKNVDDIERKGNKFILSVGKEEYEAKTVIYATGTEWKKLNVPGEEEFTCKGVHYCAVCDGNFYKNKIVAVVGSGASAGKDALVMANIASKVYIIARKEDIHPEPITYERIKANKKIEIINHAQIIEILGDKKVKKIKLNRTYNGSNELELDGIFIDVGHIPLTDTIKKLGVKLNTKGEIIADKTMKTNIPGFFVAGDVADIPFKQVIIATSTGCLAAYSAYEYITNEHVEIYEEEK
ncbi:MAG: FAD-dependent oxidoreductase [Candidatus Pacearchaeota archaeon]|jgi:thioredoxin reductase (NADPH)